MQRSIRLAAGLGAFAAAAAALAPSGDAGRNVLALSGSVGPGFTISLKGSSGRAVKKLKAGRYTISVRDQAAIHDFHLVGPGVDKVITAVEFTGSKRITLTLRKGTYTFVCDPHSSFMRGSFKVV